MYLLSFYFFKVNNMNIFDCFIKFSIKPSVQRMAIMEYLVQNKTHPTVEEIYIALSSVIPTLSKTTVYNTLKLFTEQGAIQMLTIDERNVCFDAVIDPHPHFLCKKCGTVYDIEDTAFHNYNKLHTQEGHIVDEIHFYYKGICNNCQN